MPIDVNDPFPGGLQGINAFIGGYASPEAAEQSVNSSLPQGYRDYISKQYQDLTGDSFADPFKDTGRARDAALMSTIDAGKAIGPSGMPISTVSVAAGSNVGGPRILGVGAGSPLIQGPGMATMQPLGSPQQMQASTPDQFSMAMARNPLANDYSNQQRRVNETGDLGVQLYQHLKQNNPEALTPMDMTNQQLQLDEKGNPIAGNVLNPKLFNDPRFQLLLKTNPVQAQKVYQALHGRDLSQDLKMQAAHEGAVNKSDRDVLDQFKKSGDFDELGRPFMRQMVSDPFNPGQQKEQKRPLSFFERQVLTKNKNIENITGQNLPGQIDLAKAGVGNLTPAEKETFFKNYDATDPSLPTAQRILKARQMSGAVATKDEREPSAWDIFHSWADEPPTRRLNRFGIPPVATSQF